MTDQPNYSAPSRCEPTTSTETEVTTLERLGPPVEDLKVTAPASLPQMLVEARILAADQIIKVQEAARRERLSLGRILVRDGVIPSRDLATLTAVYLGLTMVDLKSETIDPQAVGLIPEDLARKHLVFLRK